MALRVSQATFHAAVVENMVEFEMSKGEALADAIEQFKQQGVDLSNLDLSGSAIREDGTVEVHPLFTVHVSVLRFCPIASVATAGLSAHRRLCALAVSFEKRISQAGSAVRTHWCRC